MLDGEDWKYLPGTSGDYAVSSYGRVVSFKAKGPRLLSIVVQESRGRKYSHVCIHGKKVRVHRLVASVFVPNQNGHDEIDHLNNDPLDNRASNLKWCSHAENMRNPNTRDSIRQYRLAHPFEKNGDYPRNVDTSVFYNRHEDKMKEVAQIKDGVVVAKYRSIGEADRCGYRKASVSAAINGRLKTYRGYQWILFSDLNSSSI